MEPAHPFGGLFEKKRIFWQTRSGSFCVGLDQLCPISVASCLDDGREYEELQESTGIQFCSLERAVGKRDHWTDNSVDDIIPAVRNQIERAMREQRAEQWVVASPYPSPALESFAAEAGCPCACQSSRHFWWFSDKSNFYSGLRQLGLPGMAGRWRRLTQARYEELRSELGTRFVAQLALGAGGTGTAFIGTEAEFTAAASRFGGELVWVTPYMGDLSVNVNAIAMENGVAVGYPSVQLVGLEMLCAPPGRYCGNDFSAAGGLPRGLLDNVRGQTERIGRWMASLGYRGLFGLDFVIDGACRQACAVDLNPRWQGSTVLQTQAELRDGRLPLAAAELAYRLGVLDEREILNGADEFFAPIRGSHMYLQCRRPGWWQAGGDIRSGVYSPALEYLRPAFRFNSLQSTEELLVTGAIPHPGRPIAPGVPLFRICSERPIVESDGARPLPWAKEAARRTYLMLDLKAVQAEQAGGG